LKIAWLLDDVLIVSNGVIWKNIYQLFGVLEISVIENPKEDERFFWKECYQK
jgi:hypothetical protein